MHTNYFADNEIKISESLISYEDHQINMFIVFIMTVYPIIIYVKVIFANNEYSKVFDLY